jgi:O-antigen ligase
MLIIILITLLSGCLPNEWLINGLRVPIGGVPINIVDVLLAVGVVGAVFARTAPQYKPPSVHPLFTVTLILFVIAGITASFRAFTNAQHVIAQPWYLRCARHYLTMPAALVIGYAYVRTPRSAMATIVTHIIAGVAAAVLIAVFFHSKTTEYSGYDVASVNVFRTTQYVTSYSTIAAAILIFARINRLRLLPRPVGLLTIMLCLTGVFVTITRSDWVSCFAALVPAVILTPVGVRLRRVVRALPITVGIALVLALAVFVASEITQKDFGQKVNERLLSLLPWDTSNGATQLKAWDTRTPGMKQEIDMWLDSPVVGQGFGSQYAVFFELANEVSMRHNAFTSVLAEAGLLGILPVLLMFTGMFVIGWRLIRRGSDRSVVLAGAFVMIIAWHYVVKGMATMSFNQEREAMIVGLAFGMVLRMRGVDQAIRQWYAGYVDDPAAALHGVAETYGEPHRPSRGVSGGTFGAPVAAPAATSQHL